MDSKVLESLMIPEENLEAANEGLIGGIILSILALPVIFAGGCYIVCGMHVAKENRKKEKAIKAQMKNNKGKAINYRENNINLLENYSKNIEFVEEPKDYAQIIPKYKKLYVYAKELDSHSSKLYNNYKAEYSHTPNEKYFIEINKAIEEFRSSLKYDPSNKVKVPFNQSSIYKLYDMVSEIEDDSYSSYYRANNLDIDVDEDTFEKITEVLLAYNTTCNDIAKALNINKLLENCNFILKGKLKKSNFSRINKKI